jgi:DNA-directed RNA polymerase specialized sigma24 family protein
VSTAAGAAAVERSPGRKKDWALTQSAFDLLLTRLDRDPHDAARQYEGLRRRLITFVQCRGGAFPEDLADETINRVARRLVEGTEIHSPHPADYFYGVARRVLSEHWHSPDAASVALDDLPPAHLTEPAAPWEARAERDQREHSLTCLERCLENLSSDERELITGYYQGETAVKIGNRKLLATRLGIAINALRIRALRIREKLQACVEGCLQSNEMPLEGGHY